MLRRYIKPLLDPWASWFDLTAIFIVSEVGAAFGFVPWLGSIIIYLIVSWLLRKVAA